MNRLLLTALTLTITTASPMAPEQPTQQGWFSRALTSASSFADSARRNIAASPLNPVAIFSSYVTVPLYAAGIIDPSLQKLNLTHGDFIKMSLYLQLQAQASSDLNFITKARAWHNALNDRLNMIQLDNATQTIISTHNDTVNVLIDGQFDRMVTSQNTAAIKTIRSSVLRELAALHTLLIANSANPYKNTTVIQALNAQDFIKYTQNNQDNTTSSDSDNDFLSLNSDNDYQADTEEQESDVEEAPTTTTNTEVPTQQDTSEQPAPLSPMEFDGNISDPMSLSSDEEQNKPNFETEDLYSGTSASETDTNVAPTAPISPRAKAKKRPQSFSHAPGIDRDEYDLRSKKSKTTNNDNPVLQNCFIPISSAKVNQQ